MPPCAYRDPGTIALLHSSKLQQACMLVVKRPGINLLVSQPPATGATGANQKAMAAYAQRMNCSTLYTEGSSLLAGRRSY
jgi:hypothetical protein